MSEQQKTDRKTGNRQRQRDLDDALEDTFPASDPVSTGQETGDEKNGPRGRIDRKTPLIDAELVKRLARKSPNAKS